MLSLFLFVGYLHKQCIPKYTKDDGKTCVQCRQPVLVTQQRVKNSEGYLHVGKCLDEYTASGRAPVAACGLCGLAGQCHMLHLVPSSYLHIPPDIVIGHIVNTTRATQLLCHGLLLCSYSPSSALVMKLRPFSLFRSVNRKGHFRVSDTVRLLHMHIHMVL